MVKISDELIHKIKDSNDIVDTIGSYLPLTQKGKNFFAVCPFHDDHSPSMSISKEKQIFKCFVCGHTGNSISFVQDYLGISFVEALEVLAKNAHIDLKLDKKENANSPYKDMYSLYNIALSYYKNNLNSKEGEEARKYLEKRKLDKDTINYFDIGLSLSGGLSEGLSKKYSENLLEEAGLSNNGKDVFINRIMFTIKDNEGNPAGFSGRKYDDSDVPKYVNSKETPIFKKGNILYNYYNAKNDIKKKKEIIISEGFMEVIRCHTIGIDNVVALMGTSFTKDHLAVIKKDKVDVVLNLDQDEAGKIATIQIGKLLMKEGISPTVIIFSKYKDADELIVYEGAEAFINAYEKRVNFIDFELDYLKKNKDLSDSVSLAEYIKESIEAINAVDDDILREIKVKELSDKYGIDSNLIKSKITNNNVTIKKEVKKVPVKKIKYDKYAISEIRILYLMMNYPELIDYYENYLGYLNDVNRKKLADAIVFYKEEHKTFDYSDFICYTCVREDLNVTLKSVCSYPQSENYTKEELEDYIMRVKEYRVQKQEKVLRGKLKNTIDKNEQKKIAERLFNMKKEVLKW